jgi:hypothetical protein
MIADRTEWDALPVLFGAPRREWLAVVVPPIVGVALVVIGAGEVTGGEVTRTPSCSTL